MWYIWAWRKKFIVVRIDWLSCRSTKYYPNTWLSHPRRRYLILRTSVLNLNICLCATDHYFNCLHILPTIFIYHSKSIIAVSVYHEYSCDLLHLPYCFCLSHFRTLTRLATRTMMIDSQFTTYTLIEPQLTTRKLLEPHLANCLACNSQTRILQLLVIFILVSF